jgi:putative sterol carrier protein
MAKGKAVQLWLSVLKEVAKEPDVAEQLKDVSFSLVITFTDQNNESLSLIIDKGKQTSKEGAIPNPMAQVSFGSKVFEGLVTEKVSPMKAIQKRMLTIDGDLSALLNLVYLLPAMKKNYEKLTAK